MKSEYRIPELDTTVSQIDSALLKLSRAPKEGYVPFDFKNHVEKLLFLMRGESDYYLNKVKAFYFVFRDLREEAAVEWSELEAINDGDNSILWKKYRHDRNKPDKRWDEKLVYYEKDKFEKNKTVWKVGYKTSVIRLSKLDMLLETVSYEAGGNQVALRLLEGSAINECAKLIEGAQLNFLRDTSLTFEKYVGWIGENEVVETFTAPPLPKLTLKCTPAQAVYLLNLHQEKGYIGGFTASGERNGRMVLQSFTFEGYNPSAESLGRYFQQIKKDELPISAEDAAKFLKFPHRSELKK